MRPPAAGGPEVATMRAAVLREVGRPMAIEEVTLAEPRPGEARVRIVGTGVCHSDYHVIKGEWASPLPIVLGHEASGVVEAVGAGVTQARPGDHVVLSFAPNCGQCADCVAGQPHLCSAYLTVPGAGCSTAPAASRAAARRSPCSARWPPSPSTPWSPGPA